MQFVSSKVKNEDTRYLDFRVTMKVKFSLRWRENVLMQQKKTSNFHTRSTSFGTIHTNDKEIKVFEKVSLIQVIDLDKWHSLFLNILSVFLSSSCINVQRKKYLR